MPQHPEKPQTENPLERLGSDLSSIHISQNAEITDDLKAGMAAGNFEAATNSLAEVQRVLREAGAIEKRLNAAMVGLRKDLGYIPSLRLGTMASRGTDETIIGVHYAPQEAAEQLAGSSPVAGELTSGTPEPSARLAVEPKPEAPVLEPQIEELKSEALPIGSPTAEAQVEQVGLEPVITLEPISEPQIGEPLELGSVTAMPKVAWVIDQINQSPAAAGTDQEPILEVESSSDAETQSAVEGFQRAAFDEIIQKIDQTADFSEKMLAVREALALLQAAEMAEPVKRSLGLTTRQQKIIMAVLDVNPNGERVNDNRRAVVEKSFADLIERETDPQRQRARRNHSLNNSVDTMSSITTKLISYRSIPPEQLQDLDPTIQPYVLLIQKDPRFATMSDTQLSAFLNVEISDGSYNRIIRNIAGEAAVKNQDVQSKNEEPPIPVEAVPALIEPEALVAVAEPLLTVEEPIAAVLESGKTLIPGASPESSEPEPVIPLAFSTSPGMQAIFEAIYGKNPGITYAEIGKQAWPEEAGKVSDELLAKRAQVTVSRMRPVLVGLNMPVINQSPGTGNVARLYIQSIQTEAPSSVSSPEQQVATPESTTLKPVQDAEPITSTVETAVQPALEAAVGEKPGEAPAIPVFQADHGEIMFDDQETQSPEVASVVNKEPPKVEAEKLPIPALSLADAWRLIDLYRDLSQQDLDILRKNGIDLRVPNFVARNADRIHHEHKNKFDSNAARDEFARTQRQWEGRLTQAAANFSDTLKAHASYRDTQNGLMILNNITPEQIKLLLNVKNLK